MYIIDEIYNSKSYHQILPNWEVLEKVIKTTFVEHISDTFRLPVRTQKQLQYKKSVCTDILYCGYLNVRTGDLRMSAICSTIVVLSTFSKTVKFVKNQWKVFYLFNFKVRYRIMGSNRAWGLTRDLGLFTLKANKQKILPSDLEKAKHLRKEQIKICYYGVSNNSAWMINKFLVIFHPACYLFQPGLAL